jgi:hypothetical protein
VEISVPSIRELLELMQHWPDVTILVGSDTFGWLLTIALEWWFLPIAIDPEVKRRQQGATFLFCWLISASTAVLLWTQLDPADPLGLRISVSTVVGAFGFFAYPPLARLLSDKFPSIGSAWDGLRGKQP